MMRSRPFVAGESLTTKYRDTSSLWMSIPPRLQARCRNTNCAKWASSASAWGTRQKSRRRDSAKQMWHKAAAVARDELGVLAQADAARVAVDQPAADHDGIAVEPRRGEELLVDEWPGAVSSLGLQLHFRAVEQSDIGPLAAPDRLAHLIAGQRLPRGR